MIYLKSKNVEVEDNEASKIEIIEEEKKENE
jgi:hypothetical protein